MTAAPVFDKGLANTVAAETRCSFIDGAKGVLEYVGYDIDSLARNSTFEETVFLLWNGRLPNPAELEALAAEIRAEYDLPEALWRMIRETPRTAHPMHMLRTLVSSLGMFDAEADATGPEANRRKSVRILAKTPTIIANFDRHRKGKPFVRPDASMDMATNFLNMLNGARPTEAVAKALDVCLILHADHGLNASTFAARVTISTLSDMYSAITTAIGTLKGPLHGGANEKVLEVLGEIGSAERADAWVHEQFAAKRVVMGFGHRVYKDGDVRARLLGGMCREMVRGTAGEKIEELAERVERIMLEKKSLKPNLDWPAARVYHALGLPVKVFTPIFVVARMSGWTAHVIEQIADNRIIRPLSIYSGPPAREYAPLGLRG